MSNDTSVKIQNFISQLFQKISPLTRHVSLVLVFFCKIGINLKKKKKREEKKRNRTPILYVHTYIN